MTINLIRSGELKSHFIESKKKLKLRLLPLFLFSMTSNAITAGTFYFGVYVSTSLIEKLNKDEQFAVLDHELGHIRWLKNDLILLLYFTAPILFIDYLLFRNYTMCLYTLPFFILFLILRIFMLDYIVNIKINAEFAADKTSAELGNSHGLISSLTKIDNYDHKKFSKIVLTIIKFIYWFYFSNRSFYPSIRERIEKINEYA